MLKQRQVQAVVDKLLGREGDGVEAGALEGPWRRIYWRVDPEDVAHPATGLRHVLSAFPLREQARAHRRDRSRHTAARPVCRSTGHICNRYACAPPV